MKKTYHHIQEFVENKNGGLDIFQATITTISASETQIWAGLAIVGKGDKFCRKTGRELAEARAMTAIKNTTLFVGELPKLPTMTAFFGSVEDFKLFIQVVRYHKDGTEILKRRFKVR